MDWLVDSARPSGADRETGLLMFRETFGDPADAESCIDCTRAIVDAVLGPSTDNG